MIPVADTQGVLPAFADYTPDCGKSLDERFDEWIALNPWVLVQLERLADELVDAGVARFGVKALVERLRWDWEISRATTGDTWKLNNTWTSRLARRLIEKRPDLEPMIETRRLRS